MPRFLLTSGLPSYPANVSDDAANLVSPLYAAFNSFAQHVSRETGNISYSQSEQSQLNPITGLQSARFQRIFVRATVALNFGHLLSLTVAGDGRIEANRATAAAPARPALAICDTPGGIPAGQFGEAILLEGYCMGISGTILGTTYYLAVDGAASTFAPTATGAINQIIGTGLGTLGIYFRAEIVGRRPTHYSRQGGLIRVNFADGTHMDF